MTSNNIQIFFLAAVKAVTAAQLSMASHGVYSVTLDEAIEAMRLTAADMSVKYKETSLSVRTKLIGVSRLDKCSFLASQGLAVSSCFSKTLIATHLAADECEDSLNCSRMVSLIRYV
jgi:hypothetical protein